jgi:hypothetical protein
MKSTYMAEGVILQNNSLQYRPQHVIRLAAGFTSDFSFSVSPFRSPPEWPVRILNGIRTYQRTSAKDRYVVAQLVAVGRATPLPSDSF